MASQFDPGRFNVSTRDHVQTGIQSMLERTHLSGGLSNAIDGLHQQQVQWGIVKESPEFERRMITNPADPCQQFIVTANRRRRDRFSGFGLATTSLIHEGCKLCIENIQSRSVLQLTYEFDLAGRRVNALVNPYPNGKDHITIATREHMRHHYCGIDEIAEIVTSVATLSRQLPERMVFWHGPGAGMSIDHRHYQVLRRHDVDEAWPLEKAAAGVLMSGQLQEVEYAISVWALRNSADSVIPRITRLIGDYSANSPHASANIAATCHLGDPRAIDMFCCLRDDRRVTQRLAGAVGTLEVLGEIVFSSDAELQRFNSASIVYTELAQILTDASLR